MWCSGEDNSYKIPAGFIQMALLHPWAVVRLREHISLSSSFFSFASTEAGPFLPIPPNNQYEKSED